jgi:hypothetical protein
MIKTYLKYLLIAIGFMMLAPNSSHAGGFPVRPKRLLLSPSFSYFYADRAGTHYAVKTCLPITGQFESLGFSLYAEYGLSRRLTLIGLLPYVRKPMRIITPKL